MATVGQLVINLEARTDKLQRELNKAKSMLKRTGRNMEEVGNDAARTERKVSKAFARMSVGAGGLSTRIVATSRAMKGLAIAGAAALGGSFVSRTIATTDALGKMAGRLGVNVEALQKLTFAASQSGVSQKALERAMQRTIRKAQEAADGNKQMAANFAALGVSIKQLQTLAPEDIFIKVVANAGKVENGFARLIKITASEGAALKNMANIGEEGINLLMQKASDLGLVFSEEMVKNAEAANDQLDIMQRVISAQVTTAILRLAPAITRVGNSFARIVTSLVSATKGFNTLTSNEQAIVNTLNAIGSSASFVGKTIGFVVTGLRTMARDAALGGLRRQIALLDTQISTSEKRLASMAMSQGVGRTINTQDQRAERLRLQNFTAQRKALRLESTALHQGRELPGTDTPVVPVPTGDPPPAPPPTPSPLGSPSAQGQKADSAFAKQTIDRFRKGLAAQERANETRLQKERQTMEAFRAIRDRNTKEVETTAATITEKLLTPMQAFQASAQDTFTNVQNAAIGMALDMEDAMVQFVMTGKLEFQSLVNSILADLTRLAVRQAFTGALDGGLGGGIGMLFGGGGATADPSLFAGANLGDFARGGIVPGPVGRPRLATVHGGEAVLTPGQRRSSGGITVNVFTPDAESFRRSTSQIARDTAQAMERVRLRDNG